MTPQTVRVLVECDTLLAEISRNYTAAVRQLEQAAPGFPAHTPAAGEPGTGKHNTARSSIVERLALHPHPELDAAQRLHHEPHTIMAATIAVTETLRLPHPNLDLSQHRALQALLWSRWAIRHTLQTTYNPPTRPLSELHGTIIDLHSTVITWAYTPTAPTRPSNPHLLADDPTDQWCRSCLRIGVRSPRYRGDLDRWCYTFNAQEGFLPPPELLEKHERGTVYDRDVEPWRKAHRDRNKRKRRKAG